jgi:predicted transglutaminase-like cysteine proteinase
MMVATMISNTLNAKWGAVLIAALAAGAIDALPAGAGSSERLTHVRIMSEVTRPPPGWIEFCERQPRDCAGATTAPRDFALTPEAWRDLVHVNKRVNETIKPLSDLEHWGVVERWSYPDDGYGDCEDYVLLKRRMLIQSGWPREALLVTVVRDKKGDGHAVLTVATDKGDYVLDNQNEDILLWWKTGYRFIKRQSQSNPNVWVSLGNLRPAIATATYKHLQMFSNLVANRRCGRAVHFGDKATPRKHPSRPHLEICAYLPMASV